MTKCAVSYSKQSDVAVLLFLCIISCTKIFNAKNYYSFKCLFLKIKYLSTGVLYNFDIVTLLWHSLKSGPEARDSRSLGHGTLTPGTLALGPWDLGCATLSPRTQRIRFVTQIPSILTLEQQLTRTADCVKQILIIKS